MAFSTHIAATRFGYGLSPVVAAPTDATQMLDMLRGPDAMQARFPVGTFYDLQSQQVLHERFRVHARDNPDTQAGKESHEKRLALVASVRVENNRRTARLMLRRMYAQDAFRERLVAFWSDHFTARGKNGMIRYGTTHYVEDAVRPFVTGRFADLLKSAVKHPVMLNYLDQEFSIGPGSRTATRRRPDRGLNENLAREVLELHTLGVDGPYGQKDVRALAHLFTGMSRSKDYSFQFRKQFAEPGSQVVMGVQYGDQLSLERIDAVLDDLAGHPATAAHIAQKLAVHFVADQPPAELVEALRQAYLTSGGDLMEVYAALLAHPQSWETPATNIRPPSEFISAALRALAVPQAAMEALDKRTFNIAFNRPLRLMGQQWQRAAGPDGWAEEDTAWVTPQGIAGRMEWAMRAPKVLLDPLPDPTVVARDALGENASQKVLFAAKSAESRAEGIGLVLMSPAFQRR